VIRAVTVNVRIRVTTIFMPSVTDVDAGGNTLSPCSSGAPPAASKSLTFGGRQPPVAGHTAVDDMHLLRADQRQHHACQWHSAKRDAAAGAASRIDSCSRASPTVKAVVHACLLCPPSTDTCNGRPRFSTMVSD
jgi:hypothetical protein